MNNPQKRPEVNKLTKIYTAFTLLKMGMNRFFPNWKQPTIKAYENFLNEYSIEDLQELQNHLVECANAAIKSEILLPMVESLSEDVTIIDNIINQRKKLD